MEIPVSSVKKSALTAIEAIVGPKGYSIGAIDRLNYARDSNFKSTIQNHFGENVPCPDLIVWPENTEQIQALIKCALKHHLSIIPFGAGSGVSGGTLPLNGGMVIDLKKLSKLISIDPTTLSATVQTGMLGWTLETELNRQGWTLGHFPSSIVCAGVGGYLAARSAGQNSTLYGKAEDMVRKMTIVTGTGDIIHTTETSNCDGVDLNQLFLGSEGTLGIISEVVFRIYPLPAHQAFSGFRFASMKDGLEAIRRFMQAGLKPSVVRLYDEIDTLLLLSHGSGKSLPFQGLTKKLKDMAQTRAVKTGLILPEAFNALSKLLPSGCLLALVHEGHERITTEEQKIIRGICRDMGAEDLGEAPGRYWVEHRYSVSYKASALFYQGLFTDTIEVATTWDKINELYETMSRAIGDNAIVMAHISHVYPEGGSIYFTFVAPLTKAKKSEKLWELIWDSAMKACQKVGGVISHHHGVGKIKAKYMMHEWGVGGVRLFDQFKKQYDPHNIMNIGKLVPEEDRFFAPS